MPLPTNEEFDAARERMREVFAEPIAELKDLLELIDGGLNRPETKPTYTDLEEAVVGHWGRAVAVTIGVLHLCEHSYGDLALTLNQTLAEILASAAWLLVDAAEHEARAERFWDYAVLEIAREADLGKRMGWGRRVADAEAHLDPVRVAALREQFDRKELGWTQLRNHELANAIKPYWAPSRWPTIETMLLIAHEWGNWNPTPARRSR